MTRLAIYEKGEGREDLRLAEYYRSDYIRYQILKTFFSVLIAVLIAFFIVGVYYADDVLRLLTSGSYQKHLFFGSAGFLLILILSEVITVRTAAKHFEKSRKQLKKHYNELRLLRRYYKENE
jgi:uncharacterized membrane protein (DUF485 family)